jgi:hypothetical protein
MPRRPSALALLLRLIGLAELCALAAVLAPARWLAAVHAWLGLGTMPWTPVVGYLARSDSALYALHGAMLVFISFDVERYQRLIRFLAMCALVYGVILLGIDLVEGLPLWWVLSEALLHRDRGPHSPLAEQVAPSRPESRH